MLCNIDKYKTGLISNYHYFGICYSSTSIFLFRPLLSAFAFEFADLLSSSLTVVQSIHSKTACHGKQCFVIIRICLFVCQNDIIPADGSRVSIARA